MAAKGPAPVIPGRQKAQPIQVQPPKNTAKPRGLQAAATGARAASKKALKGPRQTKAQRLAAQAARLRQSRLQAAASTVAAYNRARASAQAAAIAAYATRRSFQQAQQARQNRNLASVAYNSYLRHSTLSGKLQYAQSGIRKYAQVAVLNTLTTAQAVSFIRQRGSGQYGVFRQAVASTRKPPKGVALAAGGGTRLAAGGHATAKAPAAPRGAPKRALSSRSLPWRSRRLQWHGDETSANCVPVACVNALRFGTGTEVDAWFLRRLDLACGHTPTIPKGLGVLNVLLWDAGYRVQAHWVPVPRVPWGPLCRVPAGSIVGYRVPRGDHAALFLGRGRVVSWGEEASCDETIDEAWALVWS